MGVILGTQAGSLLKVLQVKINSAVEQQEGVTQELKDFVGTNCSWANVFGCRKGLAPAAPAGLPDMKKEARRVFDRRVKY